MEMVNVVTCWFITSMMRMCIGMRIITRMRIRTWMRIRARMRIKYNNWRKSQKTDRSPRFRKSRETDNYRTSSRLSFNICALASKDSLEKDIQDSQGSMMKFLWWDKCRADWHNMPLVPPKKLHHGSLGVRDILHKRILGCFCHCTKTPRNAALNDRQKNRFPRNLTVFPPKKHHHGSSGALTDARCLRQNARPNHFANGYGRRAINHKHPCPRQHFRKKGAHIIHVSLDLGPHRRLCQSNCCSTRQVLGYKFNLALIMHFVAEYVVRFAALHSAKWREIQGDPINTIYRPISFVIAQEDLEFDTFAFVPGKHLTLNRLLKVMAAMMGRPYVHETLVRSEVGCVFPQEKKNRRPKRQSSRSAAPLVRYVISISVGPPLIQFNSSSMKRKNLIKVMSEPTPKNFAKIYFFSPSDFHKNPQIWGETPTTWQHCLVPKCASQMAANGPETRRRRRGCRERENGPWRPGPVPSPDGVAPRLTPALPQPIAARVLFVKMPPLPDALDAIFGNSVTLRGKYLFRFPLFTTIFHSKCSKYRHSSDNTDLFYKPIFEASPVFTPTP
ncbi:unnamed protein product, partial [Nesidiocoris tenuis]